MMEKMRKAREKYIAFIETRKKLCEQGMTSLIATLISVVLMAIIMGAVFVGYPALKRSMALSVEQSTVTTIAATVESRYTEHNRYYAVGPLLGSETKAALVTTIKAEGYDEDTAGQIASWLANNADNYIRVLTNSTTGLERHMAVVASSGDVPEKCVIYTTQNARSVVVDNCEGALIGDYDAAQTATEDTGE
jgi:type II secretory pathway pseudopilin PulG